MAKQITAWQAEDGSLHTSECDAATRNVTLLVERSPLAENAPYSRQLVEWLTENAPEIRRTLEAHERACPRAVEAKPTKPLTSDRISAAIGQMRDRGGPAKAWLTRNGFRNVIDFAQRATESEVADWERFAEEPAAFNGADEIAGDMA
jgi:hypothetical protein